MADSYTVDPQQLRTHADNLETLKQRFAAVKAASAHIAQDDQAYGLLCGWISGVLEGRHSRQDELVAYVEENLGMVAQNLRDSADEYNATDTTAADTMTQIQQELPGAQR
ncbi:type VII secretion target [Actinophytocola oryzae]|uniref:Excreted virulence factor EspC (Type VII ESX diderm) n=1 Tax=Actinophytocola oryzae TaxID=502181 RepID=A0A4R7W5G7_9PSEU|nr:type VII secretion target [Actinophytocola oryzae]TDV57219.1 excreted virulence factor EspC (type VII ESX diderm) [Actinophytocola oryzae]